MVKASYTDIEQKAITFAFEKHKHQLGKDGVPYIMHPLTVMQIAARLSKGLSPQQCEYATAAAILHDVVEDTDATKEDLQLLVPEPVVDAVMLCTREEGISYRAYVERIYNSDNEIAKVVKKADLLHNYIRCGDLPDKQKLKQRYEQALQLFTRWQSIPDYISAHGLM